jgi:hypothetical protein
MYPNYFTAHAEPANGIFRRSVSDALGLDRATVLQYGGHIIMPPVPEPPGLVCLILA